MNDLPLYVNSDFDMYADDHTTRSSQNIRQVRTNT